MCKRVTAEQLSRGYVVLLANSSIQHCDYDVVRSNGDGTFIVRKQKPVQQSGCSVRLKPEELEVVAEVALKLLSVGET